MKKYNLNTKLLENNIPYHYILLQLFDDIKDF